MSKKKVTKATAERTFRLHYLPHLPYDKPARDLEWTAFVDGLCKSGEISMSQYDRWATPKWPKLAPGLNG